MKTYDLKIVETVELTEEDILDILCACIEGGSNYWAQIQNYGEEWDKIEEILPEDHTIEDHIMALWRNGYSLTILDVEEDEFYHISFEKFLDAIKRVIDGGIWDGDDVCDVDGEIGDCIMQYAAFDEIIYG